MWFAIKNIITIALYMILITIVASAPTRNDLIKQYFAEGYTQAEITYFLAFCHHIWISLRQLQRILKRLKLVRKNVALRCTEEIVIAMLEEINEGSGTCLGYKSLWRRLKLTYGLQVKRDTVMKLLRIVDPEGIEARSKKRLRRRQYIVPGPNFVWHVDGFDKLKPFGFAIHGAIDGFSRRLLWLKVAASNNNPKIIATYYLNTIKQLKVVPLLLRTDKGTENSIIGSLQCYLRYNHNDNLAGFKSFVEGKSTSNQKIECYWSQMRRHGIDFWISFFKDLRDSISINDSNRLTIECLRYCFGSIIQSELDLIMKEWNTHTIRKQRNVELPCDKPQVLYDLPQLFGTKNYGKEVNEEDIQYLQNNFSQEPVMYDPLLDELLGILSPNIEPPKTIYEAKSLLITLLNYLNTL